MDVELALAAKALASAIRQAIMDQDSRAFAFLCSQNIELILEALDYTGRKELH
jgi:hypothetical protein